MTSPTTSAAAERVRPRRRRAPVPSVARERPHWEAGAVVAGVDEVGRGPWAGPVTFGAVVLPDNRRIYKLRDSKLLPADQRERLAARIHATAPAVGIGHASNLEIDRLGMSEAMRLAARRALDALPARPDVLLIDGNWDMLADRGTVNELIVGGDARCASIAAASIVAKVARDAIMVDADPHHPVYRFASNKGYPSPEHRDALREHGPCTLHRRSWTPVAELLHPRLFDADAIGGTDPDTDGQAASSDT